LHRDGITHCIQTIRLKKQRNSNRYTGVQSSKDYGVKEGAVFFEFWHIVIEGFFNISELDIPVGFFRVFFVKVTEVVGQEEIVSQLVDTKFKE